MSRESQPRSNRAAASPAPAHLGGGRRRRRLLRLMGRGDLAVVVVADGGGGRLRVVLVQGLAALQGEVRLAAARQPLHERDESLLHLPQQLPHRRCQPQGEPRGLNNGRRPRDDARRRAGVRESSPTHLARPPPRAASARRSGARGGRSAPATPCPRPPCRSAAPRTPHSAPLDERPTADKPRLATASAARATPAHAPGRRGRGASRRPAPQRLLPLWRDERPRPRRTWRAAGSGTPPRASRAAAPPSAPPAAAARRRRRRRRRPCCRRWCGQPAPPPRGSAHAAPPACGPPARARRRNQRRRAHPARRPRPSDKAHSTAHKPQSERAQSTTRITQSAQPITQTAKRRGGGRACLEGGARELPRALRDGGGEVRGRFAGGAEPQHDLQRRGVLLLAAARLQPPPEGGHQHRAHLPRALAVCNQPPPSARDQRASRARVESLAHVLREALLSSARNSARIVRSRRCSPPPRSPSRSPSRPRAWASRVR
eukprot:scaffold3302_cov335-Prasinococcus_capsulatus_cf.AAC.8